MGDTENWPKWSPFAKTYNPLQSGSIDGTDSIPHDRALIRAMEAKYVPPNKNTATPNPAKTLFVGRLDHKTTDETLKQEFSKYGTVTHCRVVRDVVTGFSRGYAFVQFKHHEDAERARHDEHHAVLDGREILVEWENGRTMPGWIPRRLGGGFGGKKESGQLRFGGRDRPFRKPIVIKPMRRDKPSNLDEEDVKPFQETEGLPAEGVEECEKKSSRTQDNRWNDRPELRDGISSNDQLPQKSFDKPWNRRNTDGWNYYGGRGRGRGSRQSGRDQRNTGEDRRYCGKSSRDSNEWDPSTRGDKDRKYYMKSPRDQRDRNAWEDSNEKEERRHFSKSSRDRVQFEERASTHPRRSEKLEERSRRSKDREDTTEWYETYEGRSERRKKRSRRSRDRVDINEWSESHEERSEKFERRSRRSHDREDTYEWDEMYDRRSERKKKGSRRSSDRDDSDTSLERRPKKGGKHSRRSLDDRDEVSDWEDSPGRSQNDKKRSRKSSRDGSDREDTDDSELKSKKKKKHSKKSSLDRDSDDEENTCERKKAKKKKHKKLRN